MKESKRSDPTPFFFFDQKSGREALISLLFRQEESMILEGIQGEGDPRLRFAKCEVCGLSNSIAH